MILNELFSAFVRKSPISVMMRGVIENVLSAPALDGFFEYHAEVQYTRELRFATLVELLTDVVFDIEPSMHAAIQAAEDLPVSPRSVYYKLDGVEPAVAAALVGHSAERFSAIIRRIDHRPGLLDGYRVRILDGNHFAATEHRIKELRQTTESALPGKALVVLDPQLRLATEMIACLDGHRSERAMIPEVLALVAAADLWIADRNFCTYDFFSGIAQAGAAFICRQHAQSKGTAVGAIKRVGRVETGTVCEQTLELHRRGHEALTLRRITIDLTSPTRGNDRQIHVLSNLPADVSALTIADLYRKRWKIETMFQELSQTLHCEIRTLAYPKAAALAFSLALIGYNTMSCVIAALGAVHGHETVDTTVSRYQLAQDYAYTCRGMMIAIAAEHWHVFRELTPAALSHQLCELARGVRLARYRKHPRGPKKPATVKRNGTSRHVSTQKLLDKRRARD